MIAVKQTIQSVKSDRLCAKSRFRPTETFNIYRPKLGILRWIIRWNVYKNMTTDRVYTNMITTVSY